MKKSLFAFGLLGLLAFPAKAALNYYFSATGTGATTLSYVAISGRYGTPRLSYLNATSDLVSAAITFYTAGAATYTTTSNTTAQAVINITGTGVFQTNDVVCYQQQIAPFSVERLVVTIVAATNITVASNLTLPHPAGDPVYRMTAAGTIPVGAATKELNAEGGAIWNGQSRLPLLLAITGTSACSINSASGIYDVNTP